MAEPLFSSEFLRRLETLSLRARRPRWGHFWGSSHTINQRGQSIEFAGHLPYFLGDDFRAIDWKLYARFDRLFIKTYKAEVELEVHLILDATASMGHPASDRKFEFARALATALGYVALSRHNLLRASVFGGDRPVSATPWFSHRDGIFRIREYLQGVAPAKEINFAEWVGQYLSGHKVRGGACLLLTDGMIDLEAWRRGLAMLCHRQLEIKVIQVLGGEEARPGSGWRQMVVQDAETGQTRHLSGAGSGSRLLQAMESHNQKLEAIANHFGVSFSRVRTNEPFEPYVLKELPRLGFLRPR